MRPIPFINACVVSFAFAAVATLALPSLALAHPMGNFSINHYSRLAPGLRAIEVEYIIDMAEIPVFQVMQQTGIVPKTGDPSLAPYLAREGEQLKARLTLTANGHPLTLITESRQVIFPPGAGGLPTMKMGFAYRAALPRPVGAAPFSILYRDDNFTGHAGWKEIIAVAGAGATIVTSSVPAIDRSRGLTNYPTDMLHSPPQTLETSLTFRAATPGDLDQPQSVLASGAPSVDLSLQANRQSTPKNAFTQLITSNRADMAFFIMAALIAAVLGGFHAFEPGHGKTIVAAYLVGSRGTARHAVLLGSVVTASHTISVYALGIVTLYASQWIVPERLYPWLGFGSGLFIALLGATLFFRRILLSDSHLDGHEHSHGADSTKIALAHRHTWWGGHSTHPHDHDRAHGRGDPHDHHHPHDHADGHDHHHGHEHAHPEPASAPAHAHPETGTPEAVSLKSLLALGITGGMVPCPAALVVLLGALAIHRIAFGLFLIVAFSAGLAIVLVSFGFAMVYARQFIGRFNAHGPLTERWLPLASSAAIMMIGLTITVQSLVTAGLLSIRL